MASFGERNFEELKVIASELFKRWPLHGELTQTHHSENLIYSIQGDDRYVVRLTEGDHRNQKELLSELSLIEFFKKQNIRVACPARSLSGNLIEISEVSGKNYFLSVFEKAVGKAPLESLTDINHAALVGEFFGKLHSAATLKECPTGRVSFINDNFSRFKGNLKGDALLEFNKAESWYLGLPKKDIFVIHSDFHTGNYFIKDDKITLFDFDDACYSFFAHDLAIHLYYIKRTLTKEPDKYLYNFESYQNKLIESYRKVNNFSLFWEEQIPKFIRMRQIELYAWCLHMYDFDNLTKDQKVFFESTEKQILKNKDLPF